GRRRSPGPRYAAGGARPGRCRRPRRHERRVHRHRRERTGPAQRVEARCMTPGFVRRFNALLRKEVCQLVRDPSNLAVGLLLPGVLILLFGYGLSFDVKNAPVAVVMEDSSPTARDVLAGLKGSTYLAPL